MTTSSNRSRPWTAALAAALAAVAGAAGGLTAGADPLFKLTLSEPGAYRVSYEALAAAGLAGEVASAGLGLTSGGEPVPIWVDDGGDGRFGPGDGIEFVGERLAGEHSWFSPYSDANVYLLDAAASRPARMRAADRPGASCPPAETTAATAFRHLERDLLRMRFDSRQEGADEIWFWARITQVDPEPAVQTLSLDDLDRGSARPVVVRVGLRGWSRLSYEAQGKGKDHRVEVEIAGRTAEAEWNNTEGDQVVEMAVPASTLAAGDNALSLRVPPRVLVAGRQPEIDAVLLNWIEVRYPRLPYVAPGQARLTLEDPPAGGCWSLVGDLGLPVVVFGPGGTRFDAAWRPYLTADGRRIQRVTSGSAAGAFDVVAGDGWLVPDSIAREAPDRLGGRDLQADYLIVTHPSLAAAIEPLAEFHRRRGLTVEVVPVDEVYDDFNHGIVHPRAIRAFIAHAYHDWRRPAPRFVLLVGDASWDARNPEAHDENYADWTFQPVARELAGFIKNRSRPYSGAPRSRNLIPTAGFGTREGYAANDNWFVAVDGDDDLPDLAIGRLPVVEPAEVTAIVDKSIRYAEDPEPGAWRRRVVLISDGSKVRDTTSDVLADELSARGFATTEIKPTPDAPATAENREKLLTTLDGGELVVHFAGHGGRYIWRTAPADLVDSLDLFSLDDLDRLQPSRRLPVVLSMTCYSAPFDHPTADSIGEKFLRLPDKGAVGVVAASWRTGISREVSRILVDEFTRPTTMGEALARAKRRSRDRSLVNMFNLLGDPALPLAVPPAPGGEPTSVAAAGLPRKDVE